MTHVHIHLRRSFLRRNSLLILSNIDIRGRRRSRRRRDRFLALDSHYSCTHSSTEKLSKKQLLTKNLWFGILKTLHQEVIRCTKEVHPLRLRSCLIQTPDFEFLRLRFRRTQPWLFLSNLNPCEQIVTLDVTLPFLPCCIVLLVRKTDSIHHHHHHHHHHHPEGVAYRSLYLNYGRVAVPKVTSRRWWCIESLFLLLQSTSKPAQRNDSMQSSTDKTTTVHQQRQHAHTCSLIDKHMCTHSLSVQVRAPACLPAFLPSCHPAFLPS